MVTKKKTPWTSKTSSPDLSQLAKLWDWQTMRRNAISLEVISEDVLRQCGWMPQTRVWTSTIGEAWKTTSWSHTEAKWKILHSGTRSLNSFKIKLKQSVTLQNDALQKCENLWIPLKPQLMLNFQLHTWLSPSHKELKPETLNVQLWLTLLPKDAFSWE